MQADNDRKLYQLTKQLKDSQKDCRFLNEEVKNIKKTKLYQRNFSMKKDLSNLAQEKSEIEKELEIEKTKSSELNKSLQESKFKLKNEQTVKSKLKTSLNEEKTKNSELLTMLACDEVKVKIREEGSSHRYSDNIRQTFYALQGEAGVSAGNCSKVVQTVAKHLFDFEICNEQYCCLVLLHHMKRILLLNIKQSVKFYIINILHMHVMQQADKRPISSSSTSICLMANNYLLVFRKLLVMTLKHY